MSNKTAKSNILETTANRISLLLLYCLFR